MAKPVLTIENNPGSVFHIWADGSFQPKSPYIGTGYLVYDDQGHELLQKGRSFERGAHDSSTIAELLSCTAALRELPDGGHVTLHSDCEFVIDTFKNNIFTHNKKPLDTALKALFNEVVRHDSVNAVPSHERCSHYLKQAHNLSVAARQHKM